MIISAQAKLAGVIGSPIGHSLSPRLHGYWLEQYGIDGAYLPLSIRPQVLPQVMASLIELGFSGVNVTIPHKQAVRPLCHALDADAERIGAVNTIVVDNGRLRGSNSDGFGFMENLRQWAPEWDPTAMPAAVLGAGGAARAVIVALLDAGVPGVRVVNRTLDRARALADTFRPKVEAFPWSAMRDAFDSAGLLVNATSLGMQGQPPLEISLGSLPRLALVTDLVYRPLETGLLAMAQDRGNPVVDGLGMLLHQARPAFAAWFGVEPEVTDELRRFVLAELDKG